MPQKIFKGVELPGGGFECDIVLIGDEAEITQQAADHIKAEHDDNYDTNLIIQTIRDYNESSDGPPKDCSHT